MEEDIIILANSLFYKGCLDDTYVPRKKEWNKYNLNGFKLHENIKLTLEINPKNLLGSEIVGTDQGIKTQVYNKAKKLPVYQYSKFPFKYKRNVNWTELRE